MVGSIESGKIAIGKTANLKAASKNVPYGAILKTLSVWAIWIAAIGNFYCVNLVFLYQPVYLKKILGFDVEGTGVAAAVPPLLQFTLKLLSGFISDKVWVFWGDQLRSVFSVKGYPIYNFLKLKKVFQ